MKKYISIILFLHLGPLLFCQTSTDSKQNLITSRYSDSLSLVDFNLHAKGELWKIKWDFNEPLENWYGVTLNESGRVFCLDLDGIPDCSANRSSGNHLHGEMIDLQLPHLEHLFLSSNKLSGNIPDFSGLPFLLTLQISANAFEESIPNFSNLEHLVKLDLEFNYLNGTIPEFDELPNLESIYLGFNQLSGKLPSFEGSSRLKHLFVNYNQLNFDINELVEMDNLAYLLLNDNRLYGEIPDFSDWSNLEILVLSKNQLTGCIRKESVSRFKRFEIDGNAITICSEYSYFVPDAFSPNGDGNNDHFEFFFDPTAKIPNQVSLKVFSTNKQLVYDNPKYKYDWDGRSMVDGLAVQEGLYFYQILIDRIEHRSGWVFIKH